jgi:hypothetical protein
MKDTTVGEVSDRAGTPQPVTAVQQSCDPVACRHCGIYNLCLPLGLERPDTTTTYRRHTRLNDIKRLSAMADATSGRGSDAPARASPAAPVPPAG